MKFLRQLLLASLMLLPVLTASGQELTETTTLGVLTVQHPADYDVQALTNFGIGVANREGSFAVIILTAEAIPQNGYPVADNAADFMGILTETGRITGQPVPILLAGAEGFMADGLVLSIDAKGLIYALDTDGGLIVAVVAASDGISEDFRALGERIIDSVIVNPANSFALRCPINVRDLPKGTVIFCTGVQMTYPEPWSLAGPWSPTGSTQATIDRLMALTRDENYEVTLSTTVYEISRYQNRENYDISEIQYMAELAGHESFDPAEHIKTLVDEVGRKVQVYRPADFVEQREDKIHEMIYSITLNNDLYITQVFKWVPSRVKDVETLEAEMEAIALSTTMFDHNSVVPSSSEVDDEAASGQALTETTTLGALTVQHPANYSAEAFPDFGISMYDQTRNSAIVILTSRALSEAALPFAESAADFMGILTETGRITGQPVPISLAGAEGFMADGLVLSIDAKGLIYALDTDGGLIVAVVAASDGISEDFRALGERVIDSVIVNPTFGAAPQGTDEPTGENGNCEIKVKDLPEGTVIFCLGAQMTYPEGWQLTFQREYVESQISLNFDNYAASFSTKVSEISQDNSPESYWAKVKDFMVGYLGNLKDYSPEMYDLVEQIIAEHVKTLVDEAGRKVQVYTPTDLAPLVEDVNTLIYTITLNNDLFITHTFSWSPSRVNDMEALEAEMEAIALSTTVTEDYAGVPSYIEIDGEEVFVFEATAANSFFSFSMGHAQTYFIVTCPADMQGDEAPVWGTDIYTIDSSICLAAVHAGEITLQEGGMVAATMLPGQDEYEGSERNGILSSEYGPWHGSFSVEAFELPE